MFSVKSVQLIYNDTFLLTVTVSKDFPDDVLNSEIV